MNARFATVHDAIAENADHARRERERLAALTDAERAAHDRRHARRERDRVAALTDDERAEYYRQHAQLQRDRVAALTDEERAEHDRRHARQERARVAALTDDERAEHDQRHAAGERGRRARAAAAPAAAPSARTLVDTAMPLAAMEAMRLNNAMHVPTAADAAFRVNATNAHLGAEDSNFFVCAVCDVRALKKVVGWPVQNVNLPRLRHECIDEKYARSAETRRSHESGFGVSVRRWPRFICRAAAEQARVSPRRPTRRRHAGRPFLFGRFLLQQFDG